MHNTQQNKNLKQNHLNHSYLGREQCVGQGTEAGRLGTPAVEIQVRVPCPDSWRERHGTELPRQTKRYIYSAGSNKKT